jgi:predicted nucleic acid-binding Zn ribbon protein
MPRAENSCPECGKPISKGNERCPSCGEVLTLRRSPIAKPHQTLLDLNKFFIVAVVFIILIVPLGYCVRPG